MKISSQSKDGLMVLGPSHRNQIWYISGKGPLFIGLQTICGLITLWRSCRRTCSHPCRFWTLCYHAILFVVYEQLF